MKRSGSHFGGLASAAVLVAQAGCAGHNVKYVPYGKQKIPPTNQAVAVTGSIDDARACFQKAQLPHNTAREKYQLVLEGVGKLTAQLGSSDYVLIGEVYGGGNAWANQATLTKAMCEKAARMGGDVVMLFSRATVTQPYAYTTPGYSTTTADASVYSYGNYATGYGTSSTTYMPSQTYTGVMYKPQANGLVLKHVPGVETERRALLQADDAALEKAVATLEELSKDTKLTWKEGRQRRREVVAEASKESSRTRGPDE